MFIDDEVSFYQYHKKGAQETEANEFAAELLMPRKVFINRIEYKKFDIELIKDLANYFETSVTSTSIKYADFGTEPIAVVFTRDGKIKWSRINTNFAFSYIQNDLEVPINSIVNGYYQFQNQETKKTTINAFDWFHQDYQIDKFYTAKLFEQSFYIESINAAIVYLTINKLN